MIVTVDVSSGVHHYLRVGEASKQKTRDSQGASGSVGAGEEPGTDAMSGSAEDHAASSDRSGTTSAADDRLATTSSRVSPKERSKQYSCSWSARSIRNVPCATQGSACRSAMSRR